MIVDTLYALCMLSFIYCGRNVGHCALHLVKEGRYLLPLLGLGAIIWLSTCIN